MDELWIREFAGFFWGEGNFMIDIYVRKRKTTRKLADGTIQTYGERTYRMTRVRVRIIQRQDSREVLEHLRDTLGGHIYIHKGRKMVSAGNGKIYTSNQQLVWQVQDREQVAYILDLLDRSTFPTLKRREITVMRQAIELMRGHGYRWTDEELENLKTLRDELSNLRSYSTC